MTAVFFNIWYKCKAHIWEGGDKEGSAILIYMLF